MSRHAAEDMDMRHRARSMSMFSAQIGLDIRVVLSPFVPVSDPCLKHGYMLCIGHYVSRSFIALHAPSMSYLEGDLATASGDHLAARSDRDLKQSYVRIEPHQAGARRRPGLTAT